MTNNEKNSDGFPEQNKQPKPIKTRVKKQNYPDSIEPKTPKKIDESRHPSSPTSPINEPEFRPRDQSGKQGDVPHQEQHQGGGKEGISDSPTVGSDRGRSGFMKQQKEEYNSQFVPLESPSSSITTIKEKAPLSVTTVMTLLVLTFSLTIPFLSTWVKQKRENKENKSGEDKSKEELSFFVPAHFIRRGVKLKADVIATDNVEELNLKFKTDIQQHMMGRVIGIRDEKTHFFLIEMFPLKFYSETWNLPRTSFSPFIYLKDFQKPFWRKKPSLKFLENSRDFILKHIVIRFRKGDYSKTKILFSKIIKKKV